MLGLDKALESEWETAAAYLKRIKVDGGFLYLHVGKVNSCMCFVPDVDLQRYQAHLRDAYTKGYTDGQEDRQQGIDRQKHSEKWTG
jgi:hypothetical protein